MRPCRGGVSHVARLNFKTSRVGVYKCLSLIVGFAVTVTIWPREVVSCRDFILRTVATQSRSRLVPFFYANRFLTVKPLNKDTYSTNIYAQQSVDLYIEIGCFKEGDPHDQVYAKAQNYGISIIWKIMLHKNYVVLFSYHIPDITYR